MHTNPYARVDPSAYLIFFIFINTNMKTTLSIEKACKYSRIKWLLSSYISSLLQISREREVSQMWINKVSSSQLWPTKRKLQVTKIKLKLFHVKIILNLYNDIINWLIIQIKILIFKLKLLLHLLKYLINKNNIINIGVKKNKLFFFAFLSAKESKAISSSLQKPVLSWRPEN